MKLRPPRRRVALLSLAALLVALIAVLAVSALPLVRARSEAKAAVSDVQAADAAIKAHHFGQARAAIASAGSHVSNAEHDAHSLGADVWERVPVFGGAVSDARHLIAALDDATQVGRLGVQAYQEATGPNSHLVNGNTVDLPTLRRLSVAVSRIGPHLQAAQQNLDAVSGKTPVVGPKLTSLRDAAATQLASAQRSYDRYQPLLQQLPDVLGAQGPRSYLVAILNPSEQRYSGGATLTMSTLRMSYGRISFGHSYTVAEVDALKPFLYWPRVPGNIFHRPGPQRLTAATFSPWWQVSGEELLRAWRAETGQRTEGLIAIDLQGLADLFRITGPIQVAGYGQLNAGNLVHTLAGSYDTYQDPTQRHALNLAIIPAFRSRLLAGGKFLAKGQSLMRSAQGRHFVTYFRDTATERAFEAGGFAGNLSDSPYDYLGVFSQNLNGSKADYWQTRTVATHVRLAADGSARETTTVAVGNPAPPYTQPISDPKSGYLTRWLGTNVALFFPQHTKVHGAWVDGRRVRGIIAKPKVPWVYDRPMLRHSWMIPPGATRHLRVDYVVPSAATVASDGTLTYQLSLDPQDLPQPQHNSITLTIPPGYRFGTLPAGWTQVNGTTATYSTVLTSSATLTVPVVRR